MQEATIELPDDAAILAVAAAQLLQQMSKLNQTLEKLAEALEAIESRLSYATALDNQD
jgi:hypothetical protein